MLFGPDDRLPRGTYLGGHDISAIVGLHPYRSKADVYLANVLGQAEDISGRPAVRRGRIVEPGLISEIETEYGLNLTRNRFVLDDDVPFFGGTVDAIDQEKKILVEVTTTLSRNAAGMWGPDGSEDAATYKWIQAQFYLSLLGPEWKDAVIACFFADTDDLFVYPCRRNDQAIFELRDRAEAFWLDHVVPQIPPEIDESISRDVESANRLVEALYAKENANAIDMTPALEVHVDEYVRARDEESAAEERKKAAAVRIKAALGENNRCKWPRGSILWTSRNLKPQCDLGQVVESLRTKLGMTTVELEQVMAQHMKERRTDRTLRVTIKKEKTTDE